MPSSCHLVCLVCFAGVLFLQVAAISKNSFTPIAAPTVIQLSNLTVSVSWDALPPSPNSITLYTLTVNGRKVLSSSETQTVYRLSNDTIYSFQVCAFLSHLDTCSAPPTIFTWTTEPVLSSSDQIIASLVPPLQAGIVWQNFGGPFTNETAYVIEKFENGEWRKAASYYADTTAIRFIKLLPIYNAQVYFRVLRVENNIRTSSAFLRGLPNNFLQRTPTTPGVEITTLTPSFIKFSNDRKSISVNDSMLVTFDLSPDIPICSLINARLIIEQAAESIQSGGFLRVFSDFEGCSASPGVNVSTCQPTDPGYYLSNPTQQILERSIPPENQSLTVGLDYSLSLIQELLMKIATRTPVTFLVTMKDFIDNTSTTQLDILDDNNVKLQIVSQIRYSEQVQSFVLSLPSSTSTNQPPCAGFVCYLVSPQDPFLLSFTDTTVGNSRVLTRAVLYVTGSFENDYYTIGMGSGVIFDGILGPPISTCANPLPVQSLGSPNNYTLITKGWPDYRYGQVNFIHVISNSPFCLESARIELYFDTAESIDPCMASFSATPSPSHTPSHTSSISRSSSSTPPPTLTSTSTRSPTSTSSRSRTSSRTPSKSLTASHTPSVQTATATPSRTFLPSDNVLPPISLPSTPPGGSVNSSPSPSSFIIPTSSITPSCQRNCPQVQPTIVTNPGTAPIIIENNAGTPIGTVKITTPDILIVSPVTEPIPKENIVQSTVISLTLVDALGNIIQPSSAVEICFATNGDADTKNSCLGYIDNTVSPSIWRCEDKCLQSNTKNTLCGKTNHFTSFAILLTGNTGNDCDDAVNFIFDEQWKDGALIGSVAGAILFCLIIVAVVLALTPCGSVILRGKEGHRIHKLRRRELDPTRSEAHVVASDSA